MRGQMDNRPAEPGGESMTPAERSDREYVTSDINLTSYLRCRKFPISKFKREGREKVLFIFEDSPELRSAIVAYANDEEVPVRTYSNTLRDLKSLVR
jgi:hypothetical protein